jgi:hypothetical protein
VIDNAHWAVVVLDHTPGVRVDGEPQAGQDATALESPIAAAKTPH